jgi:hypothetical protein
LAGLLVERVDLRAKIVHVFSAMIKAPARTSLTSREAVLQ